MGRGTQQETSRFMFYLILSHTVSYHVQIVLLFDQYVPSQPSLNLWQGITTNGLRKVSSPSLYLFLRHVDATGHASFHLPLRLGALRALWSDRDSARPLANGSKSYHVAVYRSVLYSMACRAVCQRSAVSVTPQGKQLSRP